MDELNHGTNKQASKTFEPESPSEGFVSYKKWYTCLENYFTNANGVNYYTGAILGPTFLLS